MMPFTFIHKATNLAWHLNEHLLFADGCNIKKNLNFSEFIPALI